MYKAQDKKMIPLDILEILKRHSDENHRLKQKDILEYLKDEYYMDIDKKAVASNLERLIEEYDDVINYDEIETKSKATASQKKKNKIKDDTSITKTNFYIEHDFDESELRLLIDSLLFSKYIPFSQCKKLIEKIKNLASEHFISKTDHITKLSDMAPKPIDKVEYNVNMIDTAIHEKRKIRFNYSTLNINKKYELRKDKDGKIQEYLCTPFEMVVTNSRYYLICNMEGHDDVGIYRMERIVNVEILDEPVKPLSKVKGLEAGLNLPRHVMEHIYMNIGESGNVSFEFDAGLINDVVDWFGQDVEIKKKNDATYIASAKVNLKAMRFWALQYSEYVKVLTPKSLVDDIKKQLNDVIKKYKQ